MKSWDVPAEDVPDPLNLFQTLDFDFENGRFALAEARSKPGDHVDMVAGMDVIAALSACPVTGRPLRVEIYET